MNDTTHAEQRTFEPAKTQDVEGVLRRAWERTNFVISRAVLWSFERGSWQYDLICLAILILIFLTPRSWFRDRPTLQMTDLRHNQGVVELGLDRDGRRYMVDARLVESLAPMRLEDAINQILRRRLQKAPIVKSIDPLQDRNKVVLGYTVVIAP